MFNHHDLDLAKSAVLVFLTDTVDRATLMEINQKVFHDFACDDNLLNLLNEMVKDGQLIVESGCYRLPDMEGSL